MRTAPVIYVLLVLAAAFPPVVSAEADWTIMVFMNGKNDLAPYVERDLNEMERAGPPAGVNLVVQAGRKGVSPVYGPADWEGIPAFPDYPIFSAPSGPRGGTGGWVRRYEVLKDNGESAISSRLIEELPFSDMGDPAALAEFGNWAKRAYPARNYMLVVWNHGGGWRKKGASQKGISYDDATGHHISVRGLKEALEKIGGVTIYASDACLMQMAEVAYELRDQAQLVVGSQENEPGEGWPYDLFLMRAAAAAPLTPEALASAAVAGYNDYYFGMGTTQSAVRTAGLKELRPLLDEWVSAAMLRPRETLTAARSAATAFGGAGSRDLGHFLRLALKSSDDDPEFAALTRRALEQLTERTVVANAASGLGYMNASGLGIYLPAEPFVEKYWRLDWAADGRWDDFAAWISLP